MKRRLDLALALVHRAVGSSFSTSRRPGSILKAAARSGPRSGGSRRKRASPSSSRRSTSRRRTCSPTASGSSTTAGSWPRERRRVEGRDRQADGRGNTGDPSQRGSVAAVLERFGEPMPASPGAIAVMLNGKGDLTMSCARSTPRGSGRRSAPACAVARRRLPREDRPQARGRRARRRVSLALKMSG